MDISKLLQHCPKGMKLYSPLHGEVEFVQVETDSKNISVLVYDHHSSDGMAICNKTYFSNGHYLSPKQHPDAECILFPSKENRDWNTFQAPLAKQTPCVCVNGGRISLGFYCGNHCATQILSVNNSEAIEFEHIIPIDKYDFETHSYPTTMDYGALGGYNENHPMQEPKDDIPSTMEVPEFTPQNNDIPTLEDVSLYEQLYHEDKTA